MTGHSEVLVVGAGPAGLTASYLLTKAGISTTVIEADPVYVGGISRTASYKGYLFDIGGHRFFSKSKEVVDLWHEILPQDMIERPRLSRIYYDGKYYSYPLKAFEALTNLGVVESALCVLSFAYKQAFPHEKPITFHDWVANQFGERLFSIFFKTYTEKVWGIPCSELKAEWAAQRIKDLSLRTVLLQMYLRPRTTIRSLIEEFHYPRLGPGMMWRAVQGRIEGRLGRIPLTFSAQGYFDRNPDVEAAMGGDPLLAWQHFWLYGIYEGRAYDDEFRVFEYLTINQDLTAAFGGDWRAGALHWMVNGRQEGRLGRIPSIFTTDGYLSRNPTVDDEWGTEPTTIWLHYWLFGVFEARTFDEEFRVDEYMALNPDIATAVSNNRRLAFMHWVRYGRAEGRPGRNP